MVLFVVFGELMDWDILVANEAFKHRLRLSLPVLHLHVPLDGPRVEILAADFALWLLPV